MIKSTQEIYLVKTNIMNNKGSNLNLPSNKKFGFFFGIIFFGIGFYFLFKETFSLSWIFLSLGSIFILIGIFKPIILLPLNKFWLKFGLFLSRIINPIVIGIIFFLVISPISILSRLTGRDELRLKKSVKKTFWIEKQEALNDREFFRKQF